MRRLLRKWALHNLLGNFAGMCLFFIFSAIALPLMIFVLMFFIEDVRDIDWRAFSIAVPIWFIVFYISFLFRGEVDVDAYDGGARRKNRRRYVIDYTAFIAPMLVHLACSYFIKMCRYIYVPWERYEEVIKYAIRNRRRIPLTEIGAEGRREFKRYIAPLVRLGILQLMPSKPVGIKVTSRFYDFCTEVMSEDERGKEE